MTTLSCSTPRPDVLPGKIRKALIVMLGTATLLGGCATLSPDGGMAIVSDAANIQLKKQVVKLDSAAVADRARTRIRKLLSRRLSPGSAVQIALLNNRDLQAAFNDLGISDAQRVQASLPPDPTISIARISGSLFVEVERQILVNLLSLATLPQRKKIADAKFRQAQLKAIAEVLKLAADTRRAWYKAVGTRQTIGFLVSANTNARAVSRLFKRLGETGGVGKMDQAREHVFYAELAGQLAKARTEYAADREKLTRLMGLWDKKRRFRLPTRLPRMPRRAMRKPHIEREAIKRNVTIAMAQAELDATIKSLGLTQATRYINVLELRGMTMREVEKKIENGAVEKEVTKRNGLELEIRIPIFDFGAARNQVAEETYKRAVNRLLARAIDVRSMAREAYTRYRGAHAYAMHYRRRVLPLRRIIAEESQLRYNAMLTDVFALMAEARQRIASNLVAINAKRDFWLASANLRTAIIGGGAGGAGGADEPVMVAGADAPH